MNKNEEVLRRNIGKKIKLARSKTKYTQEKLAEKLSLSSRYISQLERGIAFGSASTIVNLCKVLNISSDFLFSDLINPNSQNISDLVDSNFLNVYLKLDSYNKQVIMSMTTELLKLQDNNSKKVSK